MAWSLMGRARVVALAFRANEVLVSDQLKILVTSEEVLLCVLGIAAT